MANYFCPFFVKLSQVQSLASGCDGYRKRLRERVSARGFVLHSDSRKTIDKGADSRNRVPSVARFSSVKWSRAPAPLYH